MTDTSGDRHLKARLRADLTTAMKARDTLTTGTLRMALAAVTTAEVSGTTAKELTDAEVMAVLGKEVRKRGEAAEAFAGAGRADSRQGGGRGRGADGYLPTPLTDDEWRTGGRGGRAGAPRHRAPVTMRQMGQVIKQVQAARGPGRRGPDLGGGEGRVAADCPKARPRGGRPRDPGRAALRTVRKAEARPHRSPRPGGLV